MRDARLGDDFNGYEGNAQSFRIVTKLSVRSKDHPGLNLTRATLRASIKYPWFREPDGGERERKWGAYKQESSDFGWVLDLYPPGDRRSAEAELMDWADDLTYAVHDLEDFFRAGLVPLDRISINEDEQTSFLKTVFLQWERDRHRFDPTTVKSMFDRLMKSFRGLEPYSGRKKQRASLKDTTAGFISLCVGAIGLKVPTSAAEKTVKINPDIHLIVRLLKEFTRVYVIDNPSLATQQYGKARVIRELFEILLEESAPETRGHSGRFRILPIRAQEVLDSDPEQESPAARSRVVADLISGLSDQEALLLHQRLLGIRTGSVLDGLPL